MSKKISVIILAAGKSSRFYQREMKLLADFNGKPLIRWAVDAAVDSCAHSTIVVTGHVREQIEATLHDSPVILVHNNDHATGLASSLRVGLAALPCEIDAAVICLADMPKVASSLIERLIGSYVRAPRGTQAIVPVYAGRWGNPALIARALFTRIMSLQGDEGAKRLLKEQSAKVVELPVDNAGVLADIDTAEDLFELSDPSLFGLS